MAKSLTVDEMVLDLGEKLKRLRLNKNIDQITLAGRAGIGVSALRNVESGAGASIHSLMSLIRALGRESWLETVAPVPTINPVTMTKRTSTRRRAASPQRTVTLHAAERLQASAQVESKKTLKK